MAELVWVEISIVEYPRKRPVFPGEQSTIHGSFLKLHTIGASCQEVQAFHHSEVWQYLSSLKVPSQLQRGPSWSLWWLPHSKSPHREFPTAEICRCASREKSRQYQKHLEIATVIKKFPFPRIRPQNTACFYTGQDTLDPRNRTTVYL